MSTDALAWLTAAAKQAGPPAPVLPPRRRVEPSPSNHPMAWADEAACAGTDQTLFYPVETEPWPAHLTEPARAICSSCPVYAACHDHALRRETDGIWAATSPMERRRLRRALAIADPASLGSDQVHDELVGLAPPYPSSRTDTDPPETSLPQPA